MTAHAIGQQGPWIGSVSDVAQTLVPPAVVSQALLQSSPPSDTELLQLQGYPFLSALPTANGTDPIDDPEPVYVIAWFTFNAVVANVFGVLGVFFLCTVDVLRIWEALALGWKCLSVCKPGDAAMTRLKVVEYRVTKAHAMYNFVSQGITSVLTLPYFCPVPCKPQISFAYLGTLGSSSVS